MKQHPSVNISPGVLYQYLPDAAEDLKKYEPASRKSTRRSLQKSSCGPCRSRPAHGPVAHLFHRGDYQQPMQEIAPAGLTVFAPEGERAHFRRRRSSRPTTGRRLAFAQWLTDQDNPALARVIVNRIWMHHFGRGIVPTPSDFGKLGSRRRTRSCWTGWPPNSAIAVGVSSHCTGDPLVNRVEAIVASVIQSRDRSGSGEPLLLAKVAATARCRGSSGPDAGCVRHVES